MEHNRTSLSYLHGFSETTLLGFPIGQLLEETVFDFPDNEALIAPFQDVRCSYADLNNHVDEMAEWVFRKFVTTRVGLIRVNVNPAYWHAEPCPQLF